MDVSYAGGGSELHLHLNLTPNHTPRLGVAALTRIKNVTSVDTWGIIHVIAMIISSHQQKTSKDPFRIIHIMEEGEEEAGEGFNQEIIIFLAIGDIRITPISIYAVNL